MSFLDRWREALGETRPWDILNPNTELASDEDAAFRYDICVKCPLFISSTGQCSRCGCFMKIKTKIKNAECPEHKWGKISLSNSQ